MSRIDGVAVDLDGTLLDKGGTIVDEAKAALQAATDRDVAVFIVTGRPIADILGFLTQNELVQAAYPHAIAAEERDLYDRVGIEFTPQAQRNSRLFEDEIALSKTLMPLIDHLAPQLSAIDPEYRVVDQEAIDRRGFIELRFSSKEAAAESVTLLHSGMADRETMPQIIRNQRGVSIRHPHSGKGRTLAQLVQHRGLRPERILAIGDSENDRSMLDGRYDFLAAAPSNAEDSIKEAVRASGGLICSRARGRGVAEAIRAMLT